MLLIALKMLVGEKTKFIGIVLGLSFASFIISQQAAILVGIVNRTFGFVSDTSQPNIWVVDPTVKYIDDIKALKETAVYQVRSIDGIEWAVPLYKGNIQARLRNGTIQTCILIGIDDSTLIGGPPILLKGKLEDLRKQDAVIVNYVGASTKLATITKDGTTIPLQIGETMELNDHRAVVVGYCDVSRTFQSQPVLYTTYGNATTFVPSQRKLLSFVIARSRPGVDPEELCRKITAVTGFGAYTSRGLEWKTLDYYIWYTGVFINFGVAIALGFIIGVVIAGQTLYNFTVDNLPYFAVFKAMGANNSLLRKMILLQAVYVSLIGWGIGIGAAAIFGFLSAGTELSFSMPFLLYLGSGFSILFICILAGVFSMHRVEKLDPAIVFKG